MALATASLTAPPPGHVPGGGDMAEAPAPDALTAPEEGTIPSAQQAPEADAEAEPEAEPAPTPETAPEVEPTVEPDADVTPAPEGAQEVPDEPEALSDDAPGEELALEGLAPVSPPSEGDGQRSEAPEDTVESAPTGFPAGDLDALGVAPEIAPEDVAEEEAASEPVDTAEPEEEEVAVTAPDPEDGNAAPEADAVPDAAVAAPGEPVASSPEPEADTASELEPASVPETGSDSASAPEAAAPEMAIVPEVSPRLPQVSPTEDPEAEAPRLPGRAADGPLSLRDAGGTAEDGAGDATGAEAGPTRPFEAYAADYDMSDPRPRMAVVLIDAGDSPVTFNALRSFPYPLSFALDPGQPDAAETMRAYRDAGFEVLALSDLPEGAAPADVETATQAWLREMPEAVALLESGPGALQRGRESSEQLAAALADIGQGLVLYPEGLDTARKLAEREGVPAATLFRDFDAKDEDQKVIRRFLDYAALKADQEGGVIMVGRLRPETVSALLVWGLADRASKVQLVPVTAVLADRQE